MNESTAPYITNIPGEVNTLLQLLHTDSFIFKNQNLHIIFAATCNPRQPRSHPLLFFLLNYY